MTKLQIHGREASDASDRDAKAQAEGFATVRQAHESEMAEDYVELIAELIEIQGEARPVDIAERLGQWLNVADAIALHAALQSLPGVRSLDFVRLFVPIEPAYMEALRAEPALFTEALERNIGLVNPTTLLTTLRMIQNVWRFEHQSRNAQEIARRAGDLYDKFVGFVQDLDTVDSRLTSTRNAFDAARNKLVSGRGNLVKRAEDLKALGVEASKSLPASLLDQAQAELSAPEPDGF